MTTATRTRRPVAVKADADPGKVIREAVLAWVPIPEMKVSPVAQRDMNPNWVKRLVAEMDLEQLGNPTVNKRGGEWYIIDGQHRIEALRDPKLGLGDSLLECWTYEGLSEAEEAEKFLQLNNKLTVNAFSKFKVGVRAGRAEEVEIDKIARHHGFRVALESKDNGAITAVNTLRRVYRRSPKALYRCLWLIQEAYGVSAASAPVIGGLGMLVYRFDDAIDDSDLAQVLGNARGGVNAMLGKAHVLKLNTSAPVEHCVAAAAIDIYNASKSRKKAKLASWWRDITTAKSRD